MSNATTYNFISNNVLEIQASKKILKQFQYLKQNINFNGFIQFQETHSSLNDEKQQKDEFNGPLFFSYGKTNYCGVATGVLGKNSFDLIDQKSDENGRILIIEAKINEYNFIVINIYNSNTESEQLKTFSILQNMLDNIEISNKEIVFEGDFSLIFDCKLETNCRNQVLKKRSLAKLVEINESLNPWDTWGIPNPQKKTKKNVT